MQTERVTFLTSRDHKAALDAFAADNKQSVGHVLREASTRYIAEGQTSSDENEWEQALELVLPELEAMLPEMLASMDRMRGSIAQACAAIDKALEGEPA